MPSKLAGLNRRRGPRPKTRGQKLTPQQQMFVREYAADPKFNAREAARKCGYKNPTNAASALLLNTLVQDELSKVLQQRARRLGVSADRVLRELTYIGLFDPGGLFNKDGEILPIQEMPQHVRRAIKGIKVRRKTSQDGEEVETRIDVELHPKIAALELIAKHLGMLNDKLRVEHGLTDDFLSKLLSHAETSPTEVIDGNYLEARLALPAPTAASAPGSPIANTVDSEGVSSPNTDPPTNDTLRATRGGKKQARSKKGKGSPPSATDDSLTFDVELDAE